MLKMSACRTIFAWRGLVPTFQCTRQHLRRSLSSSASLNQSGQPERTSVRYPIERGRYANLTEKDVDVFKGILSSDGQVLTGSDDLEGYNVDWLKTVRGDYI